MSTAMLKKIALIAVVSLGTTAAVNKISALSGVRTFIGG